MAGSDTTERKRASLAHPLLGELTEEEVNILNLIAKGYTNLMIAERLCLDIQILEHRLNKIYRKVKAKVGLGRRLARESAPRLRFTIKPLEVVADPQLEYLTSACPVGPRPTGHAPN